MKLPARQPLKPLGFWTTLRLLLVASRRRSTGRQRRQQELLQQRSANASSTNWSGLAALFAVLFAVGMNVAGAFAIYSAIHPSQQVEQRIPLKVNGRIVVSQEFLDAVNRALGGNRFTPAEDAVPEEVYSAEIDNLAAKTHRSRREVRQTLRMGLHEYGADAFIVREPTGPEWEPMTTGTSASERLAPMLGSIVLLMWFAMLIFQGEGIELDLQRRRHPMWEWLFSHPVPASAVFTAEILAPLVANPIYWGAPMFVGLVFGFQYGFGLGVLAGLLAGVPLAVATACMGKALEIAMMLRVSPRSRGAVIGLMNWAGYAATMSMLLGVYVMPKIVSVGGRLLLPLTVIPWPWLRWFLGGDAGGDYSFPLGMLTCLLLAAALTLGAVRFSVWGARQGLAGNFAADSRPTATGSTIRFGREPLYRKEVLWFMRDRSAIVQTILVPISIAGTQMFNLRYFLRHAQDSWNYLCGVAILFGTYMLWVLGPKSLASEGAALWIAQTWPRGLESLLKAKARLWTMLSSAVVGLILLHTAFLFPAQTGWIVLVGVGWVIFGRSMAEKAVTLVGVQSASGEIEKIPRGRRWAAQLGMLTFAIGILGQQWHIAVMGIVFSWMTAAAIWQNFRARLPFLYDPWSETLPSPPTLMHAMVAISILVEAGAFFSGVFQAFFGRAYVAVAQAVAYGLCSVVVAFCTWNFLNNRGVSLTQVIHWPRGEQKGVLSGLVPGLLAAVAGGLLIGFFAHGYTALLHHIPAADAMLRRSDDEIAKIFAFKESYFVMAVVFAPFAEEYLFRGLLYRALDREWGGWQAVLGSAAFFATYHHPLFWLPVGLLGAANAWIFKKTGRLEPAVLMHMVYNAVALS